LLRIIQKRTMIRKTPRSPSNHLKKYCRESKRHVYRLTRMNPRKILLLNQNQKLQKNHNTKSSQERVKKKMKRPIQATTRMPAQLILHALLKKLLSRHSSRHSPSSRTKVL